MMKTMRFICASALIAVGLMGMVSCRDKSEQEEENASVVNIEKRVASPMWTSDGDGSGQSEAGMSIHEETALPEGQQIADESDATSDQRSPVASQPTTGQSATASQGGTMGEVSAEE